MKKLTAAQQKVIDSIKASAAKFAGKTYEEAYPRVEDRDRWSKKVYEKAQKGHYLVEAHPNTIAAMLKAGIIEHEGDSLFYGLVEDKKEEETMNTTPTTATLSMKDGTVKFELNGITYKYNVETKRYAKTTPDGKTVRIGKAEYDTNWAVYEQAILDNQPSRVEVENDLEKPAKLNEHGCVDCHKCNVEHCVHRDCMRRNPRNVGGLGECPRLDNGIMGEGQKIAEEEGIELAEAELEANIRKEAKKAARKPRKSKDIAYEGHGKTLTAKQVDFLQEMVETDVWDGFDTMIWTDVLCDEIGGQFAGKPMTVGAMISTLCEKGLAERSKGDFTDPITGRTRKSTYMGFTGLGQKIAEELGL